MTTHLRIEKQSLIRKNHRLGQQVIGTKEWVDRYGWRKAAALNSVARVCRLLSFAASIAPEHQHVLEMLLAIKAVEVMENGAPAAKSYQRQLRWCYSQLGDERLEWARAQLEPPSVQLELGIELKGDLARGGGREK